MLLSKPVFKTIMATSMTWIICTHSPYRQHATFTSTTLFTTTNSTIHIQGNHLYLNLETFHNLIMMLFSIPIH